jgi:Zn finger protein HypA/HybF involved in hydrogenase expression
MHEVELASRILNALRRISADRRAKILRADLRVGELNEPSALRLWLKKLGGTEFKTTKFNIETVSLSISCKCGYSGGVDCAINTHSPVPELEITCPECGERGPIISSGRELEIINVELQKK